MIGIGAISKRSGIIVFTISLVKNDSSTLSIVVTDMRERIIPKVVAGTGLISHIISSFICLSTIFAVN